jgi:hypothetical protein
MRPTGRPLCRRGWLRRLARTERRGRQERPRDNGAPRSAWRRRPFGRTVRKGRGKARKVGWLSSAGIAYGCRPGKIEILALSVGYVRGCPGLAQPLTHGAGTVFRSTRAGEPGKNSSDGAWAVSTKLHRGAAGAWLQAPIMQKGASELCLFQSAELGLCTATCRQPYPLARQACHAMSS